MSDRLSLVKFSRSGKNLVQFIKKKEHFLGIDKSWSLWGLFVPGFIRAKPYWFFLTETKIVLRLVCVLHLGSDDVPFLTASKCIFIIYYIRKPCPYSSDTIFQGRYQPDCLYTTYKGTTWFLFYSLIIWTMSVSEVTTVKKWNMEKLTTVIWISTKSLNTEKTCLCEFLILMFYM